MRVFEFNSGASYFVIKIALIFYLVVPAVPNCIDRNGKEKRKVRLSPATNSFSVKSYHHPQFHHPWPPRLSNPRGADLPAQVDGNPRRPLITDEVDKDCK